MSQNGDDDGLFETPDGWAVLRGWPFRGGYLVPQGEATALRRFGKRVEFARRWGLYVFIAAYVFVDFELWQLCVFLGYLLLFAFGPSTAYAIRCRHMARTDFEPPPRATLRQQAERMTDAEVTLSFTASTIFFIASAALTIFAFDITTRFSGLIGIIATAYVFYTTCRIAHYKKNYSSGTRN